VRTYRTALKRGKMHKNNVLLLERAIMDGSAEDVAAVIRECGPFDFTARALGLSVRFGDPAKTLLLIKAGASFDYDTHSNVLRIYYNTIFSTSEIWGEDYPGRYFLMPVFDRITERLVFFGTIYDESDDIIRINGEERPAAPEPLRAESLELLCKYNIISQLHRETMLFYAILFGCEHIEKVLRNCGTKLTRFDLADSFIRLINSYSDIKLASKDALQRLLQAEGADFAVSSATFTYLMRYYVWFTEHWQEFLTLLVCGHAESDCVIAAALKLIEFDKSDALSELSELIPHSALDRLTESAISGGKSKSTAFLLNLKHKGITKS
jgi:hypothetical protein